MAQIVRTTKIAPAVANPFGTSVQERLSSADDGVIREYDGLGDLILPHISESQPAKDRAS
jgi:hypothetical protein